MSTTYLHVQQQLTTVEGFVFEVFFRFFFILVRFVNMEGI